MRRIFIEMGQGIALKGDAVIVSSALHSCCLIGAHNGGTGEFGAFHYPAEVLREPEKHKKTLDAMNDWIISLTADQIDFIFAQAHDGYGNVSGSSAEDAKALRKWFPDHGHRGCAGTSKTAVSGAVMRKNGKFFTGRETEVLDGVKNVSAQEDCSNLTAGIHVLTGGLECEIFGSKNP